MITTYLIKIIIAVIGFFMNPLLAVPDVTLPAGLIAGVSSFVQYGYTFNAVLPLDTLFEVLGVVLVFETSVFVFKTFTYGVKKIPTIG